VLGRVEASGLVVVLLGRLLTVGRLAVLGLVEDGREAVAGLALLPLTEGLTLLPLTEGLTLLPLTEGLTLLPLTVGRVEAPAPVFLGLLTLAARELSEPGVLLRRTLATY